MFTKKSIKKVISIMDKTIETYSGKPASEIKICISSFRFEPAKLSTGSKRETGSRIKKWEA